MSADDIARRVSGRIGELGRQRVADDMTVDPLHDVEAGADHRFVLAERDDVRHGDTGVLQRGEHAIFARHVVRCRQHVCERWPAHHETTLAVIDDVGQIRAAAGDDLATERSRQSADVRAEVRSERLEVKPRRRRHC
jgi:hypothetical protein